MIGSPSHNLPGGPSSLATAGGPGGGRVIFGVACLGAAFNRERAHVGLYAGASGHGGWSSGIERSLMLRSLASKVLL